MINFDALIETSRGHDQTFQFELIDTATNLPVNLNGYALIATFRERGKTPLILTLTDPAVSIVSSATGNIELLISQASSKLLPSRDLTYCQHHDDCHPYTCIMQIHGEIAGKKYLLTTIAIDNISSTLDGET